MKPEVIGVTTEVESIAKMLGVESESDYGLYQETKMGRYYAKFLSDGSFEEKVVRLISHEQAAELETSACAAIKKAGENIQKVIASTPVIDMEKVNRNMDAIRSQAKERAEQMGKDIQRSLERAGFHPTYSN